MASRRKSIKESKKDLKKSIKDERKKSTRRLSTSLSIKVPMPKSMVERPFSPRGGEETSPKTVTTPSSRADLSTARRPSVDIDRSAPVELYLWGGCAYNKLGVCAKGANEVIGQGEAITEDQLSPQLIVAGHHITTCSLGETHSAALDARGGLFTWGLNEKGQMAITEAEESLGDVFAQRILPAGMKKLTGLHSRYLHTAVTASDGKVYMCGWNQHGQLGLGDTEDRKELTLVSGLKKKVAIVTTSYTHTAALTDNGLVWTWGRGDKGQLGHDATQSELKPTKIPRRAFGGKVVSVSCGFAHTAAVTANGHVFTWGWNKYGQLGISKNHTKGKELILTPCIVDAFTSGKNSGPEPVQSIACGYYHTVCITQFKGAVYAWGRGNHGQLGLGTTEDQHTPQIVERLVEYYAKSVQCGALYTLAVSASVFEQAIMHVYGWGNNSLGQLGLGDREDRLVPTVVPLPFSPPKKVTIYCGDEHAAAIVTD